MESLTDSELIKKYKNEKNQQAFTTLYNRYKNKLTAYIFKMIRDEHKAEEIVQKTFYKMISKLDRYTEEGVFGAWIYTVAYNTTIDYIRKNKKFFDVQNHYETQDFFETLEYEYNPEKEYIGKEYVDIVEDSVDKLINDQSEVVKKRIDGELFKDIADDMGSNINTTLGRMRYARINLEKMLGKTYGEAK